MLPFIVLTSLLPFVLSHGHHHRRASLKCGVNGYDKGTNAYEYIDSPSKANVIACNAACAGSSRCKSFAFGAGVCLLYSVTASANIAEDSSSPYSFFDKACSATSVKPISTRLSSTKSIKASSSSRKSTRASTSQHRVTPSSAAQSRSVKSGRSKSRSTPPGPSASVQAPSGRICDQLGYDKGHPGAYYHSVDRGVATFASCSNLCREQSCASFAFNKKACLLYSGPLAQNFESDPTSQYRFFDATCVQSSGSILASSPVPSSTHISPRNTASSSSEELTFSLSHSSLIVHSSSTEHSDLLSGSTSSAPAVDFATSTLSTSSQSAGLQTSAGIGTSASTSETSSYSESSGSLGVFPSSTKFDILSTSSTSRPESPSSCVGSDTSTKSALAPIPSSTDLSSQCGVTGAMSAELPIFMDVRLVANDLTPCVVLCQQTSCNGTLAYIEGNHPPQCYIYYHASFTDIGVQPMPDPMHFYQLSCFPTLPAPCPASLPADPRCGIRREISYQKITEYIHGEVQRNASITMPPGTCAELCENTIDCISYSESSNSCTLFGVPVATVESIPVDPNESVLEWLLSDLNCPPSTIQPSSTAAVSITSVKPMTSETSLLASYSTSATFSEILTASSSTSSAFLPFSTSPCALTGMAQNYPFTREVEILTPDWDMTPCIQLCQEIGCSVAVVNALDSRPNCISLINGTFADLEITVRTGSQTWYDIACSPPAPAPSPPTLSSDPACGLDAQFGGLTFRADTRFIGASSGGPIPSSYCGYLCSKIASCSSYAIYEVGGEYCLFFNVPAAVAVNIPSDPPNANPYSVYDLACQ